VTTNGGIEVVAMMTPLTSPTATPDSSASTTARAMFRCRLTIVSPVTMLVRATVDPTDRSMPPARMTKVMPTAMIRDSAASRATTVMLLVVMK